MKKLLSFLLSLMLLVSMLANVAVAETAPEMRIVCMAPSMVECVYALGLGDKIVGWSAYTDYPVAATTTEGYQPYQYYYDTDTQDFDAEYELGKKPGPDGEYKQVAVVSKFYDYNQTILDGLNPTIILCEGSDQATWVDALNEQG